MGAYRPFDLRVLRAARLSPSFVRVTLGGPGLTGFSFHGYDQRMNLAFGPSAATLLTAPDWTAVWRGEGIDLRTYTIRAFRPATLEVDVDFVLHGDTGPAGPWAAGCTAGDRMVMIAATPGHPVSDIAWSPPPGAGRMLIAADETAVPAVAGILASLPSSAAPTVVVEVPTPDDRFDVPAPPGTRITWLARSCG